MTPAPPHAGELGECDPSTATPLGAGVHEAQPSQGAEGWNIRPCEAAQVILVLLIHLGTVEGLPLAEGVLGAPLL